MSAAQIQGMITEAVRQHQAGRLDQAAPLYQRILTLDPNHADALNLLGLVAVQTGQNPRGAELIGRAIAVNGRVAPYHFNLGLALQGMGDNESAIASYRRALVLKPNDPDACNNLGNALAALGRLDEAMASFRRVLAADPGNVVVLNNLGNVLSAMGQAGEAEAHYRKAVTLKPDYAEGLSNLGNMLRAKGALSEALACYRRALAADPANPATHNNIGLALWNLGRRDEAVDAYRKALSLDPGQVEAMANLGVALWENGQLDEADTLYRRLLAARPHDPDLLNNFAALCMARGQTGEALDVIRHSLAVRETTRARRLFVQLVGGAGWSGDNRDIRVPLIRALTEPWDRPGRLARAVASLLQFDPVIGPMMARGAQAWPARLAAPELLGEDGFAALARDELLLALLTSAPNTDMTLERFLTMARAAMGEADDAALPFLSALAQQCFINEYVFLPGDGEMAAAEALRQSLSAALASGAAVDARDVLRAAAYFPLSEVAGAEKLLEQSWPAALEAVLTQQLREPLEERRLKSEIPRLTPVHDDVSRLVQSQYEENPYPRWVRLAPSAPDHIVNFLAAHFPAAAFERNLGRVMQDYLIAGCGTGQQSISAAQKFGDAHMLAVDLSLASLAYARRKAEELGLRIGHGQADILELAALGRQFDVIECQGVLHHMADPFAGWRALLALLRPGGFMKLGFYSEVARRPIVAARAQMAERGFGGSADDIRNFRQELMQSGDPGVVTAILRSEDFYSVSACRDLLFHVQEQRMSLPQIGEFLKSHNLGLLGFELDDAVLDVYRQRLPDDPAATDLSHWEAFEAEHPGMFAGMYVFWIQKP